MYEEYGEGRKACFGEDVDSNDEDNSGWDQVQENLKISQHRNEYPDEEEDSEEDGSNGGYCDEEELATGVRGLLWHVKKIAKIANVVPCHTEGWGVGLRLLFAIVIVFCDAPAKIETKVL